MKLHRFEQVNPFYEKTQDYLLIHPAEHNLLLGIIQTLIEHPQRYNSVPYLVAVESDKKIVAVAIRTPPYGLVLSRITDEKAINIIAQDLEQNKVELPAVSSPKKEAKAFVQIWYNLTHKSYNLEMQLRIHQLNQVHLIPETSGYLRQAIESEHHLLLQWYQAFIDEAMPLSPEKAESMLDSHLSQNLIYLWQDKIPVSMAVGTGTKRIGGRIGPVYTPPEFRRRGYASSCVAALSQHLLNQGYPFCYLFTDLANPTSNHIYHKIGYQPVCDWQNYSFSNS